MFHMLLIICSFNYLTSGMGMSTSQGFLLKRVMPVFMLQMMRELFHCTMLVCKFGTFFRQCFSMSTLLSQCLLSVYVQMRPKYYLMLIILSL